MQDQDIAPPFRSKLRRIALLLPAISLGMDILILIFLYSTLTQQFHTRLSSYHMIMLAVVAISLLGANAFLFIILRTREEKNRRLLRSATALMETSSPQPIQITIHTRTQPGQEYAHFWVDYWFPQTTAETPDESAEIRFNSPAKAIERPIPATLYADSAYPDCRVIAIDEKQVFVIDGKPQ